MKTTSFPSLLHAFFHEWLGQQRNLSHHTVMSYRDTWRLFLRFVSQRQNRPVALLSLAQLNASEVLAFLLHIEQERKVTVGTRNCRLAALHSFFAFVAQREPLALAQCTEVLRIPTKKTDRPAMCYLDADEVTAILKQPDRSRLEGQRDHALLAFLYNTGARIQEALSASPGAIRFESPAQVRLFGKGRKERICPLWPETVELLKALLRRQPRSDDEVIFVNCYGRPLGAAGVRFKLDQYVRAASREVRSLRQKNVTPHTFRHTAGVHLVAAGVDVTVIRSWLGHASLDTTNHYARANIETKRKALEQVDPSTRPGKPPRWKREAALLAWLDSL
ncbi:MAG TPA: tyrosine-type recombinase/integrase [Steroidobacter sp.]|uniref:tyrosine-type recombinase/integrase n=1 Tax=Steroidobacter sp. TaxID=1978227 RepID=UPI002ED79A29